MKNGKTPAPDREGDTLGYARVSTTDQDLAGQQDRLEKAGAVRIFTDVISGGKFDRPGFAELINQARPGDRLCVTRLDRLGRSLIELLETVEDLKKSTWSAWRRRSTPRRLPASWCSMSSARSRTSNAG